MMNAYLVVLDEDGEKTFVVFNNNPWEATRVAISNVDDLPEQITISLLCEAGHVLGIEMLRNERSAP